MLRVLHPIQMVLVLSHDFFVFLLTVVDTGGIEPSKTSGANRVTCLWLLAHLSAGWDSNPRTPKRKVLQTFSFSHSLTYRYIAETRGFEPLYVLPPFCFQGSDLTNSVKSPLFHQFQDLYLLFASIRNFYLSLIFLI